MTQEPGKRIVSKGEYAAQVFKKTGLSMGSTSMVLAALLLFFFALGWVFLSNQQTSPFVCANYGGCTKTPDRQLSLARLYAGLGVVCLGASALFRKAAAKAQLDTPITRANTADLPASDSLVRASQEPLQAQETVLLRAAMETTEENAEELLRASIGGKEE